MLTFPRPRCVARAANAGRTHNLFRQLSDIFCLRWFGFSVLLEFRAFIRSYAKLSSIEDAVKQCAPEIHVFEGRVCTGDQFISSAEQKDAIVSEFGGLCCEMEGGAIAQICYQNEIPFVIIRAISDKADGSAEMDYTEFVHDAAVRCAAITRYMIAH